MSHSASVPKPRRETDLDHLPSALTFFLTKAQRSQVLRSLKTLDSNRAVALLKAINPPPQTASDV